MSWDQSDKLRSERNMDLMFSWLVVDMLGISFMDGYSSSRYGCVARTTSSSEVRLSKSRTGCAVPRQLTFISQSIVQAFKAITVWD